VKEGQTRSKTATIGTLTPIHPGGKNSAKAFLILQRIERILPARKDRSLSFALPPITSARDAADISAAVIAAVSSGDITLGEAAEMGKLIDSYVRAHNAAELDDRVRCIEQVSDEELMRIIMNAQAAEAEMSRPMLN
jgi:hypothetical protein